MRKIAMLVTVLLLLCLLPTAGAATVVASDSAAPAVAAGRFHVLLLKGDGSLWAWGDNRYGQVGDGGNRARAEPFKIMDGVAWVAASQWASYAVTLDGTLYSWGNNEQGQLGLGDYVSRTRPTRVMDGVTAVAAAQNRAYALSQNGDVYAFGNSAYLYPLDVGRLSNTPRVVAKDVEAVFTGGNTTLFLRRAVLSGFGGAIPASVGDNRVVSEQRVAYSVKRCAATSDQILFTDSSNALYRLDGSAKISFVRSAVVDVYACDTHFAAVGTAGELYTWGTNDYGQLGIGSYDGSAALRQVATNVQSVAVGSRFTIAHKTNGETWSVGDNTSFQLGNGANRLSYNFLHRVLTGTAEFPNANSGDYHVVFNGELMTFDTPPVNRNGRVLVPLRAIFERLGATVTWDQDTTTASATLDGLTVEVTVGSTEAKVGGVAHPLDVAAVNINQRVLVPIRFVSEAFGAVVEYIGSERLIEIRDRTAGFELTDGIAASLMGQAVTVSAELAGGGVGTASGVAVHSGGLVLTNRHVVDGAQSVTVTVNGTRFPAEVYYADKTYDFAILKIAAAVNPASYTTVQSMRVGDIAVIADGASKRAQQGSVTLTGYGAQGSVLTDIVATNGSSGSGVYNRNLDLCGIVWGGVGDKSVAAVVPMENIARYVAEAIAYYGLNR